MKKPEKAIVLCAGFGTRMAPLSRSVPKPLMPLWGKPVLEHILRNLAAWGVREVLINLHHSTDTLFERLVHDCGLPLSLTFSYEPSILGTGGALRRADWFPSNKPFWLVNGDIAMDVDPYPFMQAWSAMKPSAALWMTREKGPLTCEVEGNIVKSFDRPWKRKTSPGYTFCGLHLVSPSVIEHVPPEGFCSIIDVYRRIMRLGGKIAGIQVPGSFWSDTGTVEGYLDAHRAILKAYRSGIAGAGLMDRDFLSRMNRLKKSGVGISGFAAISETALVSPGARLKDAVIWPGARAGRRADIREAIVAGHANVQGRAHRMAAPASEVAGPELKSALEYSGFSVRRSTAQPLAPRGSLRSFTRFSCGKRRCIAVEYSSNKLENTLYARHCRFLTSIGVSVPAIIYDAPGENILLLEDAGFRRLLDEAKHRREEKVLELYRKCIKTILPMHRDGADAARRAGIILSPPFSRQLFAEEQNLFTTFFLKERLQADPLFLESIRAPFNKLTNRLNRERKTLIHRDFQSTNILFKANLPVLVDFQGMRLGPAAYDLASLICDPYISLPCGTQDKLLEYYAVSAPEMSGNIRDTFWCAAVQRLVQAIGAFARLGNCRGTESFAGYIDPALKMLDRASNHVHDIPGLKQVLSWCIERENELTGQIER